MTTIRSMTMDDYDAVIELMRSTPGISILEANDDHAPSEPCPKSMTQARRVGNSGRLFQSERVCAACAE
ncbi:hypothetical protein ALQ72_100853 [Pseudomonas syringae pv. maculicola]|uniref:Uncharacterized protein n=1 Tax=Pseudomonas syringae pv. maculicola TaxID=59511 RepID=A0A0N0G015_PSEYM|nr:GCN5-related N-acetyltransferase [Pseudomonas syringae pv. maculicola]KPC08864.1 GCN5-related N-acetyltransferase [Pseudomonas amygdali pv. lachrymans]RMM08458.1 hypothetical protein ALQ85_102534 [Pseudomonas syringae]RMM80850.1 hypothetical protein ALQ72_100853 [Pseudomonas syringae pv. maculicola]RMV34947.1 hypothetical protein ALP13_103721 [Pseudomonas syringae pv. maculicola]